jgi:hypothetical protein
MPWKHIGELKYSSIILYPSLLLGGEWSVSRPGRFTLGERAPGIRWTEGLVSFRADLDAKEKNLTSSGNLTPGVQSVPRRWNIKQFIKSLIIRGNVLKGKVVLYLIVYALYCEGVWKSECIDPHTLDLGCIWRSVVSFTLLLLYLRRNSPPYPLHRRLGGPQSRFGHGEEIILEPTGTQTPTPRSSSP